jgi:long-chain acyl-CoA synthetase
MRSISETGFTTAATEPAVGQATLCRAFQRTASAYPDEVSLRTPGDGVSLTWAELAARVEAAAGALAAIGIGRGDTVAMMLANRPEFHIVDLAALHLGATPFSIYNTSSPEQIGYVLHNAESRVVVTERAFLDPVQTARDDAPVVDAVISIDGGQRALALDELQAPAGFDFDTGWRSVAPADVAVLIYTSGTTGPPKGVQLTHHNLLAATDAARGAAPALANRGRLLSYLPHAHVADRFFSHYPAVLTGSSITCVADVSTLASALTDVRPSAWVAVPRIWEKLKIALQPALPAGRDATEDELAALRAGIGLDQAEFLLSGAAPISGDVLEFFAGIGLEILEGYGMSESSAVISITRPGEVRIGTVGPPCPGVELRLADDGEILVRGEMVMVGYRREPDKTAEAIDPEGWLHTGDIGALDPDCNLRIVDRKKELIINAAGKNMSPANIETAIKSALPLIGHAVAIGDRRPYNVALLVLDPDAAAHYADQLGLPDASPAALASDPGLLELVGTAVQRANSRLSRVEHIKRWTLLADEWQPGGPELTPTLKIRRKAIADRYAAQIDALYQ